ncbi:MAG: hypothetical protein QXT77_04635 [Candidatus Methanomethylicaceae archaeon]
MRTIASVSLETELASRIERLAKARKIPVSRLVALALEAYLPMEGQDTGDDAISLKDIKCQEGKRERSVKQ